MNRWKSVQRGRTRTGRCRTRAEEGQSILELALTLPIILLLIGAVVDFGRAMDALIIVTNAAREGARHASVDPSLTADDVKTLVVNDIKGSGTNITTMWDIQPSAVEVNFSTDAVMVAVTYDFQLWFGGIVGLDTVQIHKQAVMPIY